MPLEAAVVIVATVLGILAMAGALFAWRAAARTSRALGAAEIRLVARAQTLPASAAGAREQLAAVRAQAERTLWTLPSLDARIDSTTADLAARRAASDRLRTDMVRSRAGLTRIRNSARLIIRAIELRREFLE